jgi:hypothetical protein
MNAQKYYSDVYLLSFPNRLFLDNNQDEIFVHDLCMKVENIQNNANAYEKYLKCSYFTYQRRMDDKAKDIQAQKEQKARLANEQKERKKVQGACQAWRAKANKGVYSLGVGDQVMSSGGGVYIIRGVNTNTFLVNSLFGSMYLQKSDLIPYNSIKTAPSQYCYR